MRACMHACMYVCMHLQSPRPECEVKMVANTKRNSTHSILRPGSVVDRMSTCCHNVQAAQGPLGARGIKGMPDGFTSFREKVRLPGSNCVPALA